MNTRWAFVENRSKYLMKSGLTEEMSKKQAIHDFRQMSKLSRECEMTGSSSELPGKGVTRCNRTACQSDKHVLFYNFVMHKNYCVNCATDIRFCNNLQELDLYPEYNETLDKLLQENV